MEGSREQNMLIKVNSNLNATFKTLKPKNMDDGQISQFGVKAGGSVTVSCPSRARPRACVIL